MATYKITIRKSAAKELEGIPEKDLRRIIKRIQNLADNPRPPGCQKLAAHRCYRIRHGDYRIIYSIDDADLIINIFKIGHRREIYRL